MRKIACQIEDFHEKVQVGNDQEKGTIRKRFPLQKSRREKKKNIYILVIAESSVDA